MSNIIAAGSSFSLSYSVSGIADLTSWDCHVQVVDSSDVVVIDKDLTTLANGNSELTGSLTTVETAPLLGAYTINAQLSHTGDGKSGELSTVLIVTENQVQTYDVPDAFKFTDLVSQTVSTVIESDEITITGIAPGLGPIAASLSNGAEISINGGAFAAVVGTLTLEPNDTIKLRLTTGASADTIYSTELDINGQKDTWSVHTDAGNSGAVFSFADKIGATPGQWVESANVAVTLPVDANIQIIDGEFNLNGAGWSTTPTNVTNGDSLKVRVMSSTAYATETLCKAIIGDIGQDFKVTTHYDFVNSTRFSSAKTFAIEGSGYIAQSQIKAGSSFHFVCSSQEFTGYELHAQILDRQGNNTGVDVIVQKDSASKKFYCLIPSTETINLEVGQYTLAVQVENPSLGEAVERTGKVIIEENNI